MKSPSDIALRRVLVGHRAAVNVVDFDERYIVSASGDRTIKVGCCTHWLLVLPVSTPLKVWRTSTSEFVRTLHGHRRGIACLQYRGNHVVSGSSDNSIRWVLIHAKKEVDSWIGSQLTGSYSSYISSTNVVHACILCMMSLRSYVYVCNSPSQNLGCWVWGLSQTTGGTWRVSQVSQEPNRCHSSGISSDIAIVIIMVFPQVH